MLYHLTKNISNICTPIHSAENTLKSIYLGGTLWDEFTSECCNENNDAFGMLFQQYTSIAVDNIYNPPYVIEWKSNMDKAYYKDKYNLDVYTPYLKIELYQIMKV